MHRLTITVEDLAQRGGPLFGYRLIAYPAPFNLKATITTPYVNIPAGGTALVTVEVERQGYAGPIRIEAKGLPEGVSVAGGDIPAELRMPPNRMAGRREAVLTLHRAAGCGPAYVGNHPSRLDARRQVHEEGRRNRLFDRHQPAPRHKASLIVNGR